MLPHSELPEKGEALEMTSPAVQTESKMLMIRGQKVMLSQHPAESYEVEPHALHQAVKRHIARIPEAFIFQLNPEIFAKLKSQFVTSSWTGTRTAPLPNRALPCSPASSTANPPFKSISNLTRKNDLRCLEVTLPALKRSPTSDAWLGVK